MLITTYRTHCTLLMGALALSGCITDGARAASDTMPIVTQALVGTNVAAEPAPGAELKRLPELVLDVKLRVPLGALGIPRALVATSDAQFWALFPDSTHVYRVTAGGQISEVGAPQDTGFRTLALRGDTLYAARSFDIWRYDQSRGSFTRVATFADTGAGPITALAVGGRQWWAIRWRKRAATLAVGAEESSSRGTSPAIRHVQVSDAGSLQVVDPDHVLFSTLRAPYRVHRLDALGESTWEARPSHDASEASSRVPLPSTALALAGLPLDSGRVLQVLANLRSDSRWLAIYGAGDTVPLRVRRISLAIGLTQSMPSKQLLLGFDDSEGRREIVLYHWSWKQ